ncbi:MAG: stage V sporulation protein AD [Clostridia bacterium]|nr:stage V sporulation protein AD [Clostridia bacterium]
MKGTLFFKNKPKILSTYTIVGPKEKSSTLGSFYDLALNDDKYGESTYEKAECKMLSTAISKCIKKSSLKESDISAIIAGDLLNQIISANFMARDFDVPFLGVYSACSTITESLILSSLLVDSGKMDNVISAAGSHFATAERQYRYPLELGAIRPPQAQWTATGAGAYLITNNAKNVPYISCATVGKVVDFGVTDANNMGAAMAPAACDTISNHFKNTGTNPSDYDLIITGDLGALGSRLLKHLLKKAGYDIEANHVDCGELIYNMAEGDFQGGSGAGCSTVVVGSYIYPKLKNGEIKRVLFSATGALLSTTSTQQGESIPSISHAIVIEI